MAAGHRAAGVDDLAVERHDAQTVFVRLRHPYGVGERLGNDGAAEKVLEDLRIFLVKADQVEGHADEAGVVHRRVAHDRAPDRVDRKEGRAAGVAAFEELDGVFAVVLRVHNDMLRRRAERRLDGERALSVRPQEVGGRAVYAPERSPLRLAHHAAHGAGEALVALFHFLEHGDAPLGALEFHRQAVRPLGQIVEDALAAAQLEAAAVDDVVRRLLALRGFFQLIVDRPDTLLVLADLRAKLLRPLGLTLHVLLQARGGGAGAFNVRADDRGGGFALALGALGGREALARLLSLDVLLVHALGDAPGGGVQRLKPRAGLLEAARDLFVFEVDALGLGVQLFQRGHPDGDLADLQLVAQHEIAFGHLGLLAQRADLHFQLLDLVVDAQEVFLRALELALGLLLAVAEARDAGRLLEDLAAVGALGRDDLGDAALADDGIAVPSQAGVHQKAVDVLETHALAVDEILALAAAIVAAGEHDLARVALKDVGGIVDDERDLRVAEPAALLGAAEDHVLHLAAAQRLCALLAHDPQNGVGNVGLSRAVGADDGGDILFEVQARLVREGLEALDLKCF